MPADGSSTGLALRRLGDRVRLLNFLVARLREKVRLPHMLQGSDWGALLVRARGS